jgi:hypothetical protein
MARAITPSALAYNDYYSTPLSAQASIDHREST